MKNVTVVILAAGTSSRMGQSKQLLQVHGTSMIRRAVNTALASSSRGVVVVTGKDSAAIVNELADSRITVVHNPAYLLGIGSSLKLALKKVIAVYPDTDAVIVLVADQPMVTAAHLRKIIATFEASGSQLIASSYSGTFGVPALFARKFFDAVLQVDDTEGAKKVLKKYESELLLLDFPEGSIDLDTPEDLARFLANEKK